jgi:DNA-binding MarR family transcriptional regulator
VTRDEAARQVTEAVTQLFFSTENQAKFHGAADELGVHPPVLKALIELEPGEGVPMRDLGDRWGCDASFVTVVCDGLESTGYAERRVAPHDRRVKTVELTAAGVAARRRALDLVYGPRAGFDALTAEEQRTVAALLAKMAAAQAAHDETLLDDPEVRAGARRMAAQRTREHRGRGAAPGSRGGAGAGWREHFEAHRQEIKVLKDELARVRDEIKTQARRPVDEAKAAKAGAKAEAKAVKAEIKAEAKGRRDEAVGHLRGGGRRR